MKSIKEELEKNVIREFNHMYVISPSNSFTMDNPDVVVRQGSVLYAVYVPNFSERNNYDYLLRRLFYSQLAYGVSLVTILLLNLDDKIDGNGLHVIEQSFSHVSRGVEDVIFFIKRGIRVNKKWDAIYEAKQWMFANYDVNTAIVAKNLKEYVNSPFKIYDAEGDTITIQSFTYPSRFRKISIVKAFDNGVVFQRKKNKGDSFRKQFEAIMTQIFLRNFNYDDGYIYPRYRTLDFMSAVNTNWQMMDKRLMLNDYCRCLSFSGILPLNIPNEESFQLIYHDFIELQEFNTYVKR